MIRISNLVLSPGESEERLLTLAARALNVRPGAIQTMTLARQSIDARKKQDVHYVYAVDVSLGRDDLERQVVARAGRSTVTLRQSQPYCFPTVARRSPLPPVVVGMGPAGLFAALYLARNGLPCILLERGAPVEQRVSDVQRYWSGEGLDPASNVQFGEGGAGTFSDGKLTTGTHDPRISQVLQTFVEAGAPADILYSHKPHIGTDILRQVVVNLRHELAGLGCDIRFGHQLTGLFHSGGIISAVQVTASERTYDLPCDALILAPGHSARDTFRMLLQAGVPLEAKPFAVGVRIEHKQQAISRQQYGAFWDQLPPSDYKLACHLPNGRSAFSFCVCPGGQVVAAASGPRQVVTNGMSLRARDGENINGGFLVGITPNDFPGRGPLAGISLQEALEERAWSVGGESSAAPAQLVGDFLAGHPSCGPGAIRPTYRPGVRWTDLGLCLPDFVADTLRGALPILDRKLNGFAFPEAVLTGVESRSSSPVRIVRDDRFQSDLSGLYPCGEGAGYAGGIVSAAVDGIRVAEAVAQQP